MPEKPLLILPKPERDKCIKNKPYPPEYVNRPNIERQRKKFDPKFDRLRKTIEDSEDIMSLRTDPASIAPERAIVFELAGPIQNFYQLIQKIEGFEYLGEDELEYEPDEDFRYEKKT